MSTEARIQQVLRLSNYMASGLPPISGVYSPLINTITNYANIILNRSANNWYTIRSTNGNNTMDSLVVGDGSDGTFSEITIAPSISVIGTVSSGWSSYFQIRWWDSSNIAVFTVDEDSPYDLKLYTVNISTGVSTSVGTLISGVPRSESGLYVGVNNTYIYVSTTIVDPHANNYIIRYLKTNITTTEEYKMPLLYYGSGAYIRTMLYLPVSVTTNYLWAINHRYGSYPFHEYIFPLSNIQNGIRIGCDIGDVFNTSAGFSFQTDYDMTSVYLLPNNYHLGHSGLPYITESDLIKYGAL